MKNSFKEWLAENDNQNEMFGFGNRVSKMLDSATRALESQGLPMTGENIAMALRNAGASEDDMTQAFDLLRKKGYNFGNASDAAQSWSQNLPGPQGIGGGGIKSGFTGYGR